MVACGVSRSAGFALGLVMLAWPARARAADRIQPKTWPLVHVSEPVAADVTRQALDRAAQLLGEPRCAAILDDFTDRDGRQLSARLAAYDVDPREWVEMVTFIDDTRHRACVSGVVAFTVPGSRVVRLCGNELKRIWQQDSRHVVATVIHELLHTLGLGENPPPSQEITSRVLARCGR